jgi:hypothetical protein
MTTIASRGRSVRVIRYRVGGETQSVGDPALPWRLRAAANDGDALRPTGPLVTQAGGLPRTTARLSSRR